MADIIINKIRTDKGDGVFDYNYLANKPELDTTLDVSGKAPDSKAVGNAIKNITLSSLGVNASVKDLNYVQGVTSNIQEQLNGKQKEITGAATSIVEKDLAVNRALISDENGKVAASDVTSAEVSHLSGAKSNLQVQIDNVKNNYYKK